MNLPQPTNQAADILKALIESNGVSELTKKYNGFRSRISELKNKFGLNIRYVEKEFTNRFGRKSKYREHFLRNADKKEAERVYREINK
jgi:hypothetical protein